MRKLKEGQELSFIYKEDNKLVEYAGIVQQDSDKSKFLMKDGNSTFAFEQLAVVEWTD